MVQWGTVDIMGMWTKQRWDIDIAGSDSQQVNIPKSQAGLIQKTPFPKPPSTTGARCHVGIGYLATQTYRFAADLP